MAIFVMHPDSGEFPSNQLNPPHIVLPGTPKCGLASGGPPDDSLPESPRPELPSTRHGRHYVYKVSDTDIVLLSFASFEARETLLCC